MVTPAHGGGSSGALPLVVSGVVQHDGEEGSSVIDLPLLEPSLFTHILQLQILILEVQSNIQGTSLQVHTVGSITICRPTFIA